MHSTDHLTVYATMPDMDVAKYIIRTLVKERLLACANLIPGVHSVYWWDESVQEAQEVAVIGKTTKTCYPLLEKRFIELHPYDVPCLVALPLAAGFAPYLSWVTAETRKLL